MDKQKEMGIIYALRQNGRASLTDMSKQTKIPISTIYEKLKHYYGSLIKKYTVVLDFSKLGYNVRIYFFLKVNKSNKEKLLEHLSKKQNVNNAYRINNSFDVLCEAVFQDINSAERFIEELQEKYSVTKLQSFYILEDIKREGFLEQEVY